MAEPTTLVIGAPAADHLALRPKARCHPGATDYWDGNWLKTEVELRVRAFRAAFDADLRVDEFADFRSQLAALHRSLQGEAVLRCMEHWVSVHAKGDGRGHVRFECEVRDDPGMGAVLRFDLEADQTGLPAMLTALDYILDAFPLVGDPRT
ncbi:MAG TPA: hypothetical protein VEB43_16845 [Anaeromyxobacter sp.]|nr:hypothetical protein [Anaeromyxobacter sp.]